MFGRSCTSIPVQLDLHLFIHSFIPDISIAQLQVHNYSETLPSTAYCGGVNTLKPYRSEGLVRDPNVAARVGFEPAAIWKQGSEPTSETPRPTLTLERLLTRGY